MGSANINNRNLPVKWVYTTPELVPLPVGFTRGHASGINDAGEISGGYAGGTGSRPYVWSPVTGATPLPLLPGTTGGTTYAINNAGAIVGELNRNPVIWQKGATGYQASFVLPNVTNRSGWSGLILTDINDSGQITGVGTFFGQSRGFVLTPQAVLSLSASAVNRDDPTTDWNSRTQLPATQAVYAGAQTGDLVSWQVEGALPGASFRWTASKIAGPAFETIAGPSGIGLSQWAFTDGSFDWSPGTWRVDCEISQSGQAPTVLSRQQVVGWRTQEYVVTGQVKPIFDYEISDARRRLLNIGLVISHISAKDTKLSALAKVTMLGLPVEANAKIWAAYQLFRYQSSVGAQQVALHAVREEDKFWMIQTMLSEFPDLVELGQEMTLAQLQQLKEQRSYRMYSRSQVRYRVDSSGRIEAGSLVAIHQESDSGPTKLYRFSQELVPVAVRVKGVEFELQPNAEQIFISSESAPSSGQLFPSGPAGSDRVLQYTAGRVGLEGRVPTFALFGRDAPFIYNRIVTRLGADGRDAGSFIRVSVDKTWHPNGLVIGKAHFNEIRIYRRDYVGDEHNFVLQSNGFMPIAGQLSSFIASGSPTWPGLPPDPEGN